MTEIDNPDEKLDLVDAHDRRISAIERSEVLGLEENGRGFARGIMVFLKNSYGELWIPIRSRNKKIAPGGLDASVGEHVGAGETYEEAAIRGLHEETNIQAEMSNLKYIGTVPPFKGMPYFHKVYTYPADATPDYDEGDFDSYEWLTPEQVMDKLDRGTGAKEILPPAIKILIKKENA